MPTLGVDMQLSRSTSGTPRRVERHASARGKPVVVGDSDEQWWGVTRHADIVMWGAVDRCREIRPAIRAVFQRHTGGDAAACREAHDPNPIRGDPPLGRALSN